MGIGNGEDDDWPISRTGSGLGAARGVGRCLGAVLCAVWAARSRSCPDGKVRSSATRCMQLTAMCCIGQTECPPLRSFMLCSACLHPCRKRRRRSVDAALLPNGLPTLTLQPLPLR